MPLRFEILTLIGQFSQHAPNRLLENSTTKEDLVDTTHLGRDKYDEFSRISKCLTLGISKSSLKAAASIRRRH